MLSIVILGSGSVSGHLSKAISKTMGARVVQVYGRNKSKLLDFEELAETTTDPDSIKEADIYIVAVNDDTIEEVSGFLHDKKGLVAHTSGSVSMDTLQSQRKGVFYPLQSFSKGRRVNFKEVPICIEANSEKDLGVLEGLAGQLSGSVYKINSEQRKKLHLAAVYVNNFTNHLYLLGEHICAEEDIPFDILKLWFAKQLKRYKICHLPLHKPVQQSGMTC